MPITIDPDEYQRQLLPTKHPTDHTPFMRLVSVPRSVSDSETSPRPARWPRWLQNEDLAEYLSVSARTVDKWVKSSILPHPMIFSDRLKRWDRLELDKHLDQRANATCANQESIADLLGKFKSKQDRHVS